MRRKQLRESPKPAPFFVDRSLGKYTVSDGLIAAGYEIHTMASVYGEDVAQRLKDPPWIKDAADNGWIILTKDRRLRYRPLEQKAILAAKANVFVLAERNLGGEEMLQRFIANMARIVLRSRHPGPQIFRVYRTRVEKWWPEGGKPVNSPTP